MVLRSYLCRNLQYFSCSGSCGLNIGSSLGWLILQGFSLSPESLAWILCAVFLKAFPELLACWLPLQTWNTGRVCGWRVGVYRACRIEDVLFSCCMTHNILISLYYCTKYDCAIKSCLMLPSLGSLISCFRPRSLFSCIQLTAPCFIGGIQFYVGMLCFSSKHFSFQIRNF